VESFKTKAAKAAEVAIKLKKDNESIDKTADTAPIDMNLTSLPDDPKKVRELEKRVTKLRNENQQLST